MSSEIKDDLLNLQKNLMVGDTSLSSRHFAEEMRKKYESKVDRFSSCDLQLLNALTEDQFSSALIPSEEAGMKALKTSGDGNCLYNSASVLIQGDESTNLVLRLLTAVELYLNPEYYADHPKLADGRSSRLSDETIFTLLLSDGAQKEFEKQGSRVDAVQAQAVLTCIEKKYGTLLRGSDCKYRESADKLQKSKILITCQKNTFGELSSKILLKPSGILLFSGNSEKRFCLIYYAIIRLKIKQIESACF